MTEKRRIMIVAGEVSGDGLGAKLVKAIRELEPATEFEFFGATGRSLRRLEVESIVNSDNLAVVGLPEVIRSLPMFRKVFKRLKSEAVQRQPDAVVLIDFPEFNLKLAKALKKQRLKVIYYVSPQIWAWRKYRVKTIKRYVDLLLTILPFEKAWYREQGVSHVEYVGSPLAREVHANNTKNDFCAVQKLDPDKPIIALLAGSRHKEMVRILPLMLESSALMAAENPEIQFIIALASTRRFEEVETAVREAKKIGVNLPEKLLIIKGETFDVLNAADAAAVTSGTATLETAIIGTPQVLVYRTSAFNFKTMRPLISIEHFGLVNLIAGHRLVKELIQNDFTRESLSTELFRLLEPEVNLKMRADHGEVADKLGRGGASKRAAEAILREIRATERSPDAIV